MNLLAAGVDLATIALYLGHANTRATEIYLHADLALKERALAKTVPTPVAVRRYRPPDTLLAFLSGRPGALPRPAPLRTGRAAFTASGSSKPWRVMGTPGISSAMPGPA